MGTSRGDSESPEGTRPRVIDWRWVARVPFTRRFNQKGVTLPGGELIPWKPGDLAWLDDVPDDADAPVVPTTDP